MHNNEHDCTGECADQGDCGCETTDDCCCEYEIQVNRPAPKFELEGVKKEEVKKYHLNDYKGKWVVLYFYPLDFTFVCPTEITAFSKRLKDFKKLNTEVLGCSTDSIHSHKAWLKDLGDLGYPLLSDMTHEVSSKYGVLLADEGVAQRGLFIIDPEGELRYQVVHDIDVGRNVDEVLRVLEALQSGGLCQVDWKPGEKTINGK
ncbi:peroxiredoxin [Patescibacteria group bacterium]|nr:peroxiredoxin [Patescibacteria group bacterium]MBU1951558.1 peroxiredoxin [Patescibacteria group bacterium]